MTETDTENFEKLIDSLDPQLVLETFDKVVCFLYSDINELTFKDITNKIDTLLVSIIKDNNNLNNEKLQMVSEGISDLVLNVLEMNKGVFDLTYEYDCGMLNAKILIYKKLYRNKSDSEMVQLKSARSDSRPVDQDMHVKYLTDRYILLQRIPQAIRSKVLKIEEFQKYLLHRGPPEKDLQKQAAFIKKIKAVVRLDRLTFDDLSLVFKKATLQTIFDFINDETRASLVFEDKTHREFMFLTCCVSKKAQKIVACLQDDSKSLLMKISSILVKSDFKVASVGGKLDKKTNRRNVTFNKLPRYNADTDKSTTKVPRAASYSSKKLLEAFSSSPDSENCDDCQPRGNKSSPDHRPKDSRTKRLLADMSTPLKSDKAMKMMMSMGWEGGALGPRGEGITEPIMPALGMVQGAGLGASVPLNGKPSQVQGPELSVYSPLNPQPSLQLLDQNYWLFNLTAVKQLLTFVNSQNTEMVFDYDDKMGLKDRNFWTGIVTKANRRTVNGFEGSIKETMCQIVTSMSRAPTTHILLDFSNRSRQVKLTKFESQTKYVHKKKRKILNQVVRSPIFATAVPLTLTAILEFLDGDSLETRLSLPEELKPHQIEYISDMVNSFNSSSQHSLCDLYRGMSDQILEKLGTSALNMSYDGHVYTLKKLIYYNRFKDCAVNTLKGYSNDISVSGQPKSSCADEDKTSTHLSLTDTDTDEPERDRSTSETELNSNRDHKLQTDGSKDFTSTTQNCDKRTESYNLRAKSPVYKHESLQSIVDDKLRPDFKVISLGPRSYPKIAVTRAQCIEIQSSISQTIDKGAVLPLLKCYGVKNGALIYGCRDEGSFKFLKDVIDALSDLTIINDNYENEQQTVKMDMKINSFDENVGDMFHKLQVYNLGLSTAQWTVVKKVVCSDFVVLTVEIDENSYKFISDSHFLLYAGIDQVQCTLAWY